MEQSRIASSAFAKYGVDWDRCWYETKRGGLRGLFGDIATELERAAPEIVWLYEEEKVQTEKPFRK